MMYTLAGKPVPLQRPRFAIKSQHAYDPQLTEKNEARLQLSIQHERKPLYSGPISLEITFFMPIAKSCSKKKKDSLRGQNHHKKPDLSNLIKFVEDAAQGILFRDDAIIATIIAKKVYDDFPRTEFTIGKDCDEKNS